MQFLFLLGCRAAAVWPTHRGTHRGTSTMTVDQTLRPGYWRTLYKLEVCDDFQENISWIFITWIFESDMCCVSVKGLPPRKWTVSSPLWSTLSDASVAQEKHFKYVVVRCLLPWSLSLYWALLRIEVKEVRWNIGENVNHVKPVQQPFRVFYVNHLPYFIVESCGRRRRTYLVTAFVFSEIIRDRIFTPTKNIVNDFDFTQKGADNVAPQQHMVQASVGLIA